MNTGVKVNDRVVDQAEIQVQRFFTIALFLTAFVLDRWELVAAQSVIFGLTFLNPGFSPYIALYRHILRPAGFIRPDRRLDNPEPHRFATLIGVLVSSLAAYLLADGYASIGWGLVWLIVVLAGIAFAGWCAGCSCRSRRASDSSSACLVGFCDRAYSKPLFFPGAFCT